MPIWGLAFTPTDLQGSGIVLTDRDGNAVATIKSSGGVLAVFEPNGAPIANIGIVTPNNLVFTDSTGRSIASLSLQDGKVIITEPEGDPVAAIVLGESDIQGEIIPKILLPLPDNLTGKVDLTGSIEVYAKDVSGTRLVLDKVSVALVSEDFTKYAKVEEGESAKAPTSAPSKSQPKQPSDSKESPSKEDPAPTKDTSKKSP
jgi:hypothetical protein